LFCSPKKGFFDFVPKQYQRTQTIDICLQLFLVFIYNRCTTNEIEKFFRKGQVGKNSFFSIDMGFSGREELTMPPE